VATTKGVQTDRSRRERSSQGFRCDGQILRHDGGRKKIDLIAIMEPWLIRDDGGKVVDNQKALIWTLS